MPYGHLKVSGNLDLVEEFPTHSQLTPMALSMRVMESTDKAHTLAVVIQLRVLSVGLEIMIRIDQLMRWLQQLLSLYVTATN